MRRAVKKSTLVRAWELGAGSEMEKFLLSRGAIREREGGNYELFSLETPGNRGQMAAKGDYFKVTVTGEGEKALFYPYPNPGQAFLEDHVRIEGDVYAQRVRPVCFWRAGEVPCGVIAWLLGTGRLRVPAAGGSSGFRAALWGTVEEAPPDAVILVHKAELDDRGVLRDVDFNFIQKDIFARDYRILGTDVEVGRPTCGGSV